MRYVGIDYHKRYSVCCATGERGQAVRERRIAGNSAFWVRLRTMLRNSRTPSSTGSAA